ncbi:DUF1178 family protein [Oceanicaulis sp. UBA2681]|uniref:DUF1178 family protein n=1 Tax=Oceanicaulis sp. UBA2681 TaxID=1947007 RepID=UPI000ED8E74E|nr:DUF1178 family protein [Oceanicaulis sp. UBA2681]HCR66449.1 DUF1178 domain-containing protein [Oceanicaulis sp.]|tara:strand:+ start:18684 stop:19112 length:429 start_codon:yes stop_codon:yes gene_type:complete
MIRYALSCADGHAFEAWFRNSDDYDLQNDRGLVECPTCGSLEISKQLMAPSVRTSRKREATANGAPDFQTLARQVQAHIRSNFDYVGESFAREARAIHKGDAPERLIYGETTAEEREQLSEEGVPCAPLPEPFTPTPPKKAN